MGKNKKEDDTFLRKKKRKTKQCYREDICRWNRGRFSNKVENDQGNRLNKDIKKENFEKDLMNLTDKNHPITMIPDHSISSNNSFKSHLNTKSFDMISTL